MAYIVYMDGLLLPVTPSKIQMKIKNKNKTISLINDAEFNELKTSGLTEISFTAMIPYVKYPFAQYPDNQFQEPHVYLDHFEQLKQGQKSFQFICSRLMPSGKYLFDTNMTVSLEDYKIEENAKEGNALNVTFNLKQYIPYKAKIVSFDVPSQTTETETTKEVSATVEETRPAESAPENVTYTVKSGDTLWNIAKKYLGNGSKYPKIAEENHIKNPNVIQVGQVLTIPR